MRHWPSADSTVPGRSCATVRHRVSSRWGCRSQPSANALSCRVRTAARARRAGRAAAGAVAFLGPARELAVGREPQRATRRWKARCRLVGHGVLAHAELDLAQVAVRRCGGRTHPRSAAPPRGSSKTISIGRHTLGGAPGHHPAAAHEHCQLARTRVPDAPRSGGSRGGGRVVRGPVACPPDRQLDATADDHAIATGVRGTRVSPVAVHASRSGELLYVHTPSKPHHGERVNGPDLTAA